jgi:hypothetical protein
VPFCYISVYEFDFRLIRRLTVAADSPESVYRRKALMETLIAIIVQAVTGIIGGEAVGAAFKQAAMGHAAKIISGAIGGIGGGALLRRPAR